MPKKLSNKPSSRLNAKQNAAVFKMLQPDCKTLNTTVATLYYHHEGKWVRQFSGVLCLERDTKKRSYYLRFYRNCFTYPEMALQRKVRCFGLTIFVLRYQNEHLIQMKIGSKWIQFLFTRFFEESSELAMALRGNMKKLKKEAEVRYYEEHPEEQKDSRFKRLFRRKHKNPKDNDKKLSPKDIGAPTDLRHLQKGSETGPIPIVAIQDWMTDPVMRQLFELMGLGYDDVFHSSDCRKKLEFMIKAHGGLEELRKKVIEKGLVAQGENPAAQKHHGSKVPPLESPMPIRALKESWLNDMDDDDFVTSTPRSSLTHIAQPNAKTQSTQPSQSVSVKTPKSEQCSQGLDASDEGKDSWLKVLEEAPHDKQGSPPKAHLAEMDELTTFSPVKLRTVPGRSQDARQSPKYTPDAETTKPPTKKSFDADSSLEEDLNKTAQEIQALIETERRRAMQHRKAQTDKKVQADDLKSEAESEASETASDSDSDNSDYKSATV